VIIKTETNREDTAQKRVVIFRRVLAVCIWGGLILLCLFHRDEITVENIVSFTPKAPVIAALVMLCLFALKSVTVFIYGGLLYAASGILFPLPVAILVNIMGTAVMTTIPFLIGKKAGKNMMRQLIQKNPKLEILQDIPNRNELFVSLFVRIIGLLPADLVSMYLGASGIRYDRYLCGTMLGLLPAIISFSVMGMSADDVTSPAFIISVCFELGLMILSVSLFLIWRRKKKRTANTPMEQ